jgi:hypothetical protein
MHSKKSVNLVGNKKEWKWSTQKKQGFFWEGDNLTKISGWGKMNPDFAVSQTF